MKALTIWQPYASLIGAGIKKMETRSWYTTYRGPILIHSGQRPMRWILKHSAEEALDVAIETFGMDEFMKLPTGRAICVVDLVACKKMTEEFIAQQDPKEIAVGDWQPGRYAWILKNPRPVEPVELLGKQGLWNADLCPVCNYNTNDFVAHPHCGGCDGVSKFEPMGRPVRCVFCGAEVPLKLSHDPRPASDTGRACGKCNMEIVVPARLKEAKGDNEE